MHEGQKKLLEGVIDTEHRSECMISLSHSPPLYILGKTYDQMCNVIAEYNADEAGGNKAAQNTLVEVTTFTWKGARMNEMEVHRKSIRVGWILEVTEIPEVAWYDYLLDQSARGNAQLEAKMKQMG